VNKLGVKWAVVIPHPGLGILLQQQIRQPMGEFNASVKTCLLEDAKYADWIVLF